MNIEQSTNCDNDGNIALVYVQKLNINRQEMHQ